MINDCKSAQRPYPSEMEIIVSDIYDFDTMRGEDREDEFPTSQKLNQTMEYIISDGNFTESTDEDDDIMAEATPCAKTGYMTL